MPNLVRGTKCVLFLLSKVPKDMHLPIVPILFSLLESHASDAKFTHPDQKWEEMCGMMGNLMADRRRRKGQTVQSCGNPLPRLPTARGGGAHETGHTHPVPQHAQDGDGRPHVRRLPQDRQAIRSRETRLTAPHLGEPPESPDCQITCGIVWNRIVTYGIA